MQYRLLSPLILFLFPLVSFSQTITLDTIWHYPDYEYGDTAITISQRVFHEFPYGLYQEYYANGNLKLDAKKYTVLPTLAYETNTYFLGEYRSYHENGQLAIVGRKDTARDGSNEVIDGFTGPYQSYYENGQLAQEGNKVFDKGDWNDPGYLGEASFYHDNGQLHHKSTYIRLNNKSFRVGEIKEYNEEGILTLSATLKVLPDSSKTDFVGAYTSWYNDGELKVKGNRQFVEVNVEARPKEEASYDGFAEEWEYEEGTDELYIGSSIGYDEFGSEIIVGKYKSIFTGEYLSRQRNYPDIRFSKEKIDPWGDPYLDQDSELDDGWGNEFSDPLYDPYQNNYGVRVVKGTAGDHGMTITGDYGTAADPWKFSDDVFLSGEYQEEREDSIPVISSVIRFKPGMLELLDYTVYNSKGQPILRGRRVVSKDDSNSSLKYFNGPFKMQFSDGSWPLEGQMIYHPTLGELFYGKLAGTSTTVLMQYNEPFIPFELMEESHDEYQIQSDWQHRNKEYFILYERALMGLEEDIEFPFTSPDIFMLRQPVLDPYFMENNTEVYSISMTVRDDEIGYTVTHIPDDLDILTDPNYTPPPIPSKQSYLSWFLSNYDYGEYQQFQGLRPVASDQMSEATQAISAEPSEEPGFYNYTFERIIPQKLNEEDQFLEKLSYCIQEDGLTGFCANFSEIVTVGKIIDGRKQGNWVFGKSYPINNPDSSIFYQDGLPIYVQRGSLIDSIDRESIGWYDGNSNNYDHRKYIFLGDSVFTFDMPVPQITTDIKEEVLNDFSRLITRYEKGEIREEWRVASWGDTLEYSVYENETRKSLYIVENDTVQFKYPESSDGLYWYRDESSQNDLIKYSLFDSKILNINDQEIVSYEAFKTDSSQLDKTQLSWNQLLSNPDPRIQSYRYVSGDSIWRFEFAQKYNDDGSWYPYVNRVTIDLAIDNIPYSKLSMSDGDTVSYKLFTLLNENGEVVIEPNVFFYNWESESVFELKKSPQKREAWFNYNENYEYSDEKLLHGLNYRIDNEGDTTFIKNWKYGIPHGYWKEFQNTYLDEPESIYDEGVYQNGKREGTWQLWEPNAPFESNFIAVGKYKNGQRKGSWKFFYPKDKLAFQLVYKKDTAYYEGPFTKIIDDVIYVFDDSGPFGGTSTASVNHEINSSLKKNKLHGKWVKKDIPTGQIIELGTYKKGKKQGVWKTFDLEGRLLSQQKFRDGYFHDKQYYYHNRRGRYGMVLQENFKNGYHDGLQATFVADSLLGPESDPLSSPLLENIIYYDAKKASKLPEVEIEENESPSPEYDEDDLLWMDPWEIEINTNKWALKPEDIFQPSNPVRQNQWASGTWEYRRQYENVPDSIRNTLTLSISFNENAIGTLQNYNLLGVPFETGKIRLLTTSIYKYRNLSASSFYEAWRGNQLANMAISSWDYVDQYKLWDEDGQLLELTNHNSSGSKHGLSVKIHPYATDSLNYMEDEIIAPSVIHHTNGLPKQIWVQGNENPTLYNPFGIEESDTLDNSLKMILPAPIPFNTRLNTSQNGRYAMVSNSGYYVSSSYSVLDLVNEKVILNDFSINSNCTRGDFSAISEMRLSNTAKYIYSTMSNDCEVPVSIFHLSNMKPVFQNAKVNYLGIVGFSTNDRYLLTKEAEEYEGEWFNYRIYDSEVDKLIDTTLVYVPHTFRIEIVGDELIHTQKDQLVISPANSFMYSDTLKLPFELDIKDKVVSRGEATLFIRAYQDSLFKFQILNRSTGNWSSEYQFRSDPYDTWSIPAAVSDNANYALIETNIDQGDKEEYGFVLFRNGTIEILPARTFGEVIHITNDGVAYTDPFLFVSDQINSTGVGYEMDNQTVHGFQYDLNRKIYNFDYESSSPASIGDLQLKKGYLLQVSFKEEDQLQKTTIDLTNGFNFDLKEDLPALQADTSAISSETVMGYFDETSWFMGTDNREQWYRDETRWIETYTTSNDSSKIHFYNSDGPTVLERHVAAIINSDGSYVFYTPENYYMASRDALDKISFTIDMKNYNFQQFDLKYNRPDIILKRLGYADSTLIEAYHKAYRKRLKKMGFTEDMLQEDYQIPDISIENFEYLPVITDSSSLSLHLKMNDERYSLDRINIFVNGVSVKGKDGIDLKSMKALSVDTTITVNLVRGENIIEVSVLNSAGAESYRDKVEINSRAGKQKPDLYLVTIGVNEFDDERYNLRFAAKDALDVATILKQSKVYGKVHTRTLTNEQVTREKVAALSDFVARAGINDKVLIFIAGHGVLDQELDYFFATHDMDFSHPDRRGLPYEEVENLLDGISPLKKLFLIDACHSGEIDKDEVQRVTAARVEEGPIQFRAVGAGIEAKVGVSSINSLSSSMFSDLRRGTGATVISSAGGMEYAVESNEWKNGLFTYCLLNGIRSGEADINGDGEIWLSELQSYITEQVRELSNGNQRPTSRIKNEYMDYRIW